MKPGDQVLMDDGMIQLRVEETTPEEVRCRVVAGGRISDHKGLSLPRVALPVSCLTDKDREDLRFGIEQGVDFVAISFVRSAADIARGCAGSWPSTAPTCRSWPSSSGRRSWRTCPASWPTWTR